MRSSSHACVACASLQCGCSANHFADAIGIAPLYLQQDGARWANATAIYEQLCASNDEDAEHHDDASSVDSDHIQGPARSDRRNQSRSECHSPEAYDVFKMEGRRKFSALAPDTTSRARSSASLSCFCCTLSPASPSSKMRNASFSISSETAQCARCGSTPAANGSPTGSVPSLNKVSSLNRSLAAGNSRGSSSRGESTLELEAVAAMHELSFAVQSISVSEMLPRTSDLIFVNVTTVEGQPYCLELTLKGWRVASVRTDCMIGDFTRLEMFTKYYDTLYALMDEISPGYRQRFGEKLAKKLSLLQASDEAGELVPSGSYCSPPLSISPPAAPSSHVHRGRQRSDSTDSLPIVTPVPSPVPEAAMDHPIFA